METLSFAQTLPYMAQGMLGIFIVTLILMAAVKLLDICTRDKK